MTILVVISAVAHAAPPDPGSDDAELMQGHRAWIEGQQTANGGSCCSWADGRPLDPSELRQTARGWEVRFSRKHWTYGTDEWLAVPPEAVLTQLSPVYLPIAWVGPGGRVYCLALSGAM